MPLSMVIGFGWIFPECLVWQMEILWELICDDVFCSLDVLWVEGFLVTDKRPPKLAGYEIV